MENVEVLETAPIPIHYDEISHKKLEDHDYKVQGAVEIFDHYAIKSNECSDSTQPLRPPRKYSNYAVESVQSSRETSDTIDFSPMKPTRKHSQCSKNRKFSTASDTSMKIPKKVSFSDELPLAAVQLADISYDTEIQIPSEYLNTLDHAMMESNVLKSDDDDDDKDETDRCSSPLSSISTQTMNELMKADMFPNIRKVSLHSERSFDMASSSIFKPGTESAATQITTETETSSPSDAFIDNERKMSTTSEKSNYCAYLV